MADEDEILRCAQDDTVKPMRRIRLSADDEHSLVKCHTMEPTSRHNKPALLCLEQDMVLKKLIFIIGPWWMLRNPD